MGEGIPRACVYVCVLFYFRHTLFYKERYEAICESFHIPTLLFYASVFSFTVIIAHCIRGSTSSLCATGRNRRRQRPYTQGGGVCRPCSWRRLTCKQWQHRMRRALVIWSVDSFARRRGKCATSGTRFPEKKKKL